MKKSTLILVFSIFTLLSYSQEYGNNVDALKLCSIIQKNSFSSDADAKAKKVLEQILNEIGASKRFVLKSCDNINNAIATSYKGIRYILYDKDFIYTIAQGNNWGNLFIFAHEVGHHVNGHSLDIVLYAAEVVEPVTLIEKRQQELEADEFAAFVLSKLGCPISEVNKIIQRTVPTGDDSYSTHPNRNKRLKAIQKGYNKAKNTSDNTWKLGQFKIEELPLSTLEISERFPNQGGGFQDESGNMLFNGGDFDINHPDAKHAVTYRSDNFSGSYFTSSCYVEIYKVDKYGNFLFPLQHFIIDDNGNRIDMIFKENGAVEITTNRSERINTNKSRDNRALSQNSTVSNKENQKKTAEEHYHYANAKFYEKKYREAIGYYSKSIKILPLSFAYN